jgi:hypothetical protein
MTKDKTCSIPGCRCKGQAIGHSEAEQGFAYWKARAEKAEARIKEMETAYDICETHIRAQEDRARGAEAERDRLQTLLDASIAETKHEARRNDKTGLKHCGPCPHNGGWANGWQEVQRLRDREAAVLAKAWVATEDNKRLREALEEIAANPCYTTSHLIARQALEGDTCQTCGGTEEIQEGTGHQSDEGGEQWRVVPCPDCQPKGEAKGACQTCGGTGWVGGNSAGPMEPPEHDAHPCPDCKPEGE